MCTVLTDSNGQPIFALHTPTTESHSDLKSGSGNQWNSRCLLQILSRWALFWEENQVRWQCIAYNIISANLVEQCAMGRYRSTFSKYAMTLRGYYSIWWTIQKVCEAMACISSLDLLRLYRSLHSLTPSHPLYHQPQLLWRVQTA